jgi:hypothetical protein
MKSRYAIILTLLTFVFTNFAFGEKRDGKIPLPKKITPKSSEEVLLKIFNGQEEIFPEEDASSTLQEKNRITKEFISVLKKNLKYEKTQSSDEELLNYLENQKEINKPYGYLNPYTDKIADDVEMSLLHKIDHALVAFNKTVNKVNTVIHPLNVTNTLYGCGGGGSHSTSGSNTFNCWSYGYASDYREEIRLGFWAGCLDWYDNIDYDTNYWHEINTDPAYWDYYYSAYLHYYEGYPVADSFVYNADGIDEFGCFDIGYANGHDNHYIKDYAYDWSTNTGYDFTIYCSDLYYY